MDPGLTLSLEEQERFRKLAQGCVFFHLPVGEMSVNDLLVLIGFLSEEHRCEVKRVRETALLQGELNMLCGK